MKDTWDYQLMHLLKQAYLGNVEQLNELLENYPSTVVVNEDYSVLLVLRRFLVRILAGERQVLNGRPESEHSQWGITVTTCSPDSAGQANVYLPNHQNYIGLKIKGNEIDILTDSGHNTVTNVTELFRKLRFWLKFDEQELEQAFNSLCNEQYKKKDVKKPEPENNLIEIPALGELKYNEKSEYYEGGFSINDNNVNISVSYAKPKKLAKLTLFVEKQLKEEFYKCMLLDMEVSMLELKNEGWLEEDEDTGEEEEPLTVEKFRQRVTIDTIIFYEDCSSEIYCDDDDIFFGHTIVISVDKNGIYKNSTIAG